MTTINLPMCNMLSLTVYLKMNRPTKNTVSQLLLRTCHKKKLHSLYSPEWYTCFIITHVNVITPLKETEVFLWCIKLPFQWFCRLQISQAHCCDLCSSLFDRKHQTMPLVQENDTTEVSQFFLIEAYSESVSPLKGGYWSTGHLSFSSVNSWFPPPHPLRELTIIFPLETDIDTYRLNGSE